MAWLLLPAIASLMLLATTNHVCQDMAVVPFLWVVPLALYLFSFILCFDHPRWYVRGLWASLAAVAFLRPLACRSLRPPPRSSRSTNWTWLAARINYDPTYAQQLVVYFLALLFVCIVCHGEVVRLRPDPRRLTQFYLWIAAGGALGGFFVTLIAPNVFTTFFEWKIGLVLCFVVASVALLLPGKSGRWRWFRMLLAVPAAGGVALVIVSQIDQPAAHERGRACAASTA